MSAPTLLGALLVAHALCDYPLQGDFLARAKNHRNPIGGVPWYQALTAHALIQAGGVWLLTGSAQLAWMEFVAHWCIDYGKSEGWFGFNADQAFHVLCKCVWVAMWLGSIR